MPSSPSRLMICENFCTNRPVYTLFQESFHCNLVIFTFLLSCRRPTTNYHCTSPYAQLRRDEQSGRGVPQPLPTCPASPHPGPWRGSHVDGGRSDGTPTWTPLPHQQGRQWHQDEIKGDWGCIIVLPFVILILLLLLFLNFRLQCGSSICSSSSAWFSLISLCRLPFLLCLFTLASIVHLSHSVFPSFSFSLFFLSVSVAEWVV